MNYKNNGFGDSLLADMISIMDSPEHKSLFSKQAQTTSLQSFMENDNAKQEQQVSPEDTNALETTKQQLWKVYQKIGEKFGSERTPLENEISKLIAAFKSNRLTKEQADVLSTKLEELSKSGPEYAELLPADSIAKAQEVAQLALDPAHKVAFDVVATMVKVADYLGVNGYDDSEVIADTLLNSIISEAKKKDKKDKKSDKKDKKNKKDKKDKACKEDKDCE